MANIKVMHKAATISTDLTIKEIKKLEALNPDCLTIKNADGDVIFSIATGEREALSKFGIVFANDSKVSVLVDAKKVNRDIVENLFGAILLQLSKIEIQANAALDELVTDLDELINIIDEDEEDEDYEYVDEDEEVEEEEE